MPQEILMPVMGRMTALKKSDSGVWSTVVSDVMRRLAARTLARTGGDPYFFALGRH